MLEDLIREIKTQREAEHPKAKTNGAVLPAEDDVRLGIENLVALP